MLMLEEDSEGVYLSVFTGGTVAGMGGGLHGYVSRITNFRSLVLRHCVFESYRGLSIFQMRKPSSWLTKSLCLCMHVIINVPVWLKISTSIFECFYDMKRVLYIYGISIIINWLTNTCTVIIKKGLFYCNNILKPSLI